MKIAFQTNTICHRGTTVAVLDYAKYNQQILGNESIIVYPENFNDPGVSLDSLTQQDVLEEVKRQFTVIGYNSLQELDQIIVDNNVDATYFIKGGFNDGLLTTKSKNLVHAVFQANQPHGDKYAYISEWLSSHMSGGEIDYVPHIVDLPKTAKTDYREKLDITKDKIVVGRIGGLHQFDIRWVLQTVANFAYNNPNYEFVFVNTAPFLNPSLPNIKFIDPIIDEQEKTDFILSCDAMIHARSDGESFGLAICEGLFHDKPVFAYNGGRDQHHLQLLEGTGLLYNNPEDLWIKLLNIKNNYPYSYSKLVEQFTPETVMKKFKQVFLS
jgi:glycosyltransferase involved in cell wall biosynthesis